MKILILSQMEDVFLHLVKDNKNISNVYLANYSFADKIYYNYLFKKHNINFINVDYLSHKTKDLQVVYNTVKELYTSSIDFQRLDNKDNIENIVLKYCNLYLNFEYFFKNTKIDVTVTWNGYFAPDKIVNYLAKKYKIKTLFYEMGLFRPNTMTIDSKIVNYGNSVPKDIEYYKNNIFTEYLINKPSKIKSSSKKKYKMYKLFDHCLYHINYFTYKRFDNIKKISLGKTRELTTVLELSDIDIRYINIFVPLQVSTDTQILLNSPDIKSMEELIIVLNGTILELNKNRLEYKIYVKKHPKDLRNIKTKFEDNIYLLNETIPSKEIIRKTNLTLTINSTVGLETIELNKPCVVLGNSFYSIKPIAFKSTSNDLVPNIREALETTNNKLQDKFIDYLKYEYQLSYNPFYILESDPTMHHKRFKELMK